MPLLAFTGGHGNTAGLGNVQNGIGISMRKLNSIKVNSDGRTATIGGGAKTYEVTEALWKEGKQTGKSGLQRVAIGNALIIT